MLRKTDNCTEYKNGNITIKYDRDTITEAGKDEVLTISSVLDQIDCYFFGETYCLSNYETGHSVYNAYSDLVYVFPWQLLEELKSGATVRIYARKPDEVDREILETEGL